MPRKSNSMEIPITIPIKKPLTKKAKSQALADDSDTDTEYPIPSVTRPANYVEEVPDIDVKMGTEEMDPVEDSSSDEEEDLGPDMTGWTQQQKWDWWNDNTNCPGCFRNEWNPWGDLNQLAHTEDCTDEMWPGDGDQDTLQWSFCSFFCQSASLISCLSSLIKTKWT